MPTQRLLTLQKIRRSKCTPLYLLVCFSNGRSLWKHECGFIPTLTTTRHLDREGRAICRIVYAHGIGIQIIANVFCVSEDTVIQAIENKPTNKDHDKAENDYWCREMANILDCAR